jgi:hypothetical protein
MVKVVSICQKVQVHAAPGLRLPEIHRSCHWLRASGFVGLPAQKLGGFYMIDADFQDLFALRLNQRSQKER